MYIVRLYKKKWAITDLNPLPASINEYSHSYQQVSGVNVFEISQSENDDDGGDDNGTKGSGGGGGGGHGGTVSNYRNNTNTKMSIHRISSTSCAHLIGLFIEQRNYYNDIYRNIEWNKFLNLYRYRKSVFL